MKKMDVEVLKDTSMSDDARRARKRYERIVMSEHEASLYCESPNAARKNDSPGYPEDYK